MQKNAGLRGGHANAHRDDKMSGDKTASDSPGQKKELKKSANKKRRQRGLGDGAFDWLGAAVEVIGDVIGDLIP